MPVHRKLRYISKHNKRVQLVVQVQYHVNVIYSLGADTHRYQCRGQKQPTSWTKQFQEIRCASAFGRRVPGLKLVYQYHALMLGI